MPFFFFFLSSFSRRGPSRAASPGRAPAGLRAGRPAGPGSNVLVWGFDLLVLQAGYARISLESWRKISGRFRVGQQPVPHEPDPPPVPGRYLLQRGAGQRFLLLGIDSVHGFRQPGLGIFSASGKPVVNDLITTSFGGLCRMGEAGFRLSTARDRRTGDGGPAGGAGNRGADPQPGLAFNRLLYGDTVLRGLSGIPSA
jgi:hypothetical protein